MHQFQRDQAVLWNPVRLDLLSEHWFQNVSDSLMHLLVGHVGEWDLSCGDLIEHEVQDGAVYYMALSGGMIVTSDGFLNQVFNVLTCLWCYPNVITYDKL